MKTANVKLWKQHSQVDWKHPTGAASAADILSKIIDNTRTIQTLRWVMDLPDNPPLNHVN